MNNQVLFIDVLNAKNMSGKKLSTLTNISTSTIYDLKNGKTDFHKCSVENAIKIAIALNMSVEELYNNLYRSPNESVVLAKFVRETSELLEKEFNNILKENKNLHITAARIKAMNNLNLKYVHKSKYPKLADDQFLFGSCVGYDKQYLVTINKEEISK